METTTRETGRLITAAAAGEEATATASETAAASGQDGSAAGETAAEAREEAGSTAAAGEAGPAAGMTAMTTPEAAAFIAERGGRLYVWADMFRCCGGTPVRIVRSSTSPPRAAAGFERFSTGDFEILLHPSAGPPPAEIRVRLRGRWRPRISVYWDRMPA
jgi:hypothetical protein